MSKEQSKVVVAKAKSTRKRQKYKRGAAKIRDAAAKIKSVDCKSIVDALVKSAKTGEIQSIKLLYSIAHSSEKAGESADGAARKVRSMASELANAPQWTGDWPKEKQIEDDETGTVS